VGAFLLFGATHYSVFDDEALSCRLYAMPMGEMLGALWRGEDPDPPLYYLLQNVWVGIFGVGPLGLRGLSIICFLAALPVLRAAGRIWFNGRVGMAAMWIAALHPAHLFFGFAGRWYSLMFLLVAVLLWVTGELCALPDATRAGGPRRRLFIAWALAAAAVCYTNYFGLVVVGLTWLAALWQDRLRRREGLGPWLVAAAGAAALLAAWMPPTWHHVWSFPESGGGWQTYAATAGRTLMALCAGNLASIGAWWVWAPMAVFALAFVVLLTTQRRRVRPIALIVLGCFAAGVASRTMIDKYIMTFSGPACLLVAALVLSRRGSKHRSTKRWSRLLTGALAASWLGCGVNLASERHFSSLRWLDPFEDVTAELFERNWPHGRPDAVVSHPAARYYFARLRADAEASNPIRDRLVPPMVVTVRTPAAAWLRAWECQQGRETSDGFYAMTPEAVLRLLESAAVTGKVEEMPRFIVTLQTTGFASAPQWEALRAHLARDYVVTHERRYLEDAAAAWKDRLDPRVTHARWRITVRYHERRD